MSVQSANNSLNGFRTIKHSPLEQYLNKQANTTVAPSNTEALMKNSGEITKKLAKGNKIKASSGSGSTSTDSTEDDSNNYGYEQDYSEAGNESIFDTGVQEDETPEYISNEDLGEPTDVSSDSRLKNTEPAFDLVEAMARLNAYDFTYTPEAQAMNDPTCSIDDDEHIGMLAQELKANPITESTVKQIGDYLAVDTKELTMVNTAVLTSICKKLQELEQKIGE